MTISYLKVTGLRNLLSVQIEPSNKINLIVGANGSGKTSLLESVCVLGTGKSFRHSIARNLVSDSSDNLLVYGKLDGREDGRSHNLGVEKGKSGKTKIKVDEEEVRRLSKLAKFMPLVVVEPNTISLIEGGGQERRKVIDWGVFHVEHQFAECWRMYRGALQQRNKLLKSCSAPAQIGVWDKVLLEYNETVTSFRKRYLEHLKPYIESYVTEFLPGTQIEPVFYRGWSEDMSYAELLETALPGDLKAGFSRYGAHRADYRLLCGRVEARDYLSRGQKKLLIYALKLAQITMMLEQTGTKTVLLLDDMHSELDRVNCKRICSTISRLRLQSFITSVEAADRYKNFLESLKPKVFHVEHGEITLVDSGG